MRERIEIEEELEALEELTNKVPPANAFGDDNQEAISAQIRVIRERMDFEDVIDEFEDEGDFILSSATDAWRWLHQDDEAASEGWAELVGESC